MPQNIRNLLVAGRSLSVSHMIDSFTRNMIPCMWFGQAAGAAAGLCIKYDTIPAELEYEKLHQELKRQGLTF
ncbi:FAD-dependent oxidoreductase [Hungatella hathewayi]|nr:FAD-dependent oxidoreductase [Hungatella hathewayi]RGZ03757.1 FAD-dependent oxidoreductase [Hungatella hathewayi]